MTKIIDIQTPTRNPKGNINNKDIDDILLEYINEYEANGMAIYSKIKNELDREGYVGMYDKQEIKYQLESMIENEMLGVIL